MSTTTPTNDEAERVPATPGTDDYNRQFRRQALRAADAALALWIVRIPCGVFALLTVLFILVLWFDSPNVDLNLLLMSLYLSSGAIELGNVAFFGRSCYLRFILSGVKRAEAQVDDRDDAK